MPPFNVKNCARCGCDHHGLQAHKFEIPIVVKLGPFTLRKWDFWAICPFAHDPILVRVH